jgi:hypothetical protein
MSARIPKQSVEDSMKPMKPYQQEGVRKKPKTKFGRLNETYETLSAGRCQLKTKNNSVWNRFAQASTGQRNMSARNSAQAAERR